MAANFLLFRLSDFDARWKYPCGGVFHMDKSEIICYTMRVLRKRGEPIFDIDPGAREERKSGFSFPGQRPEPTMARSASAPCGGGQNIRNSVLGFVAKPLTFHNEKPDTVVRRVVSTRRTLFSSFSSRFLAAPATKRDFEGAPLSFSAPKRRHSAIQAWKGRAR